MECTYKKNLLVDAAQNYMRLGYQICLTNGKELIVEDLRTHHPFESWTGWDGISIRLDSLVCVDFDTFTNFRKISLAHNLPDTLQERTPRGLHFFYRLPNYSNRLRSRIGWRKHVDLLTKSTKNYDSYYGKPTRGHALCSPSRGYSRLSPIAILPKNLLPMAPNWVLEAML